jgi:hypothetical protein
MGRYPGVREKRAKGAFFILDGVIPIMPEEPAWRPFASYSAGQMMMRIEWSDEQD